MGKEYKIRTIKHVAFRFAKPADGSLMELFGTLNNPEFCCITLLKNDRLGRIHGYPIKDGNDLCDYYFYFFKFWKIFSTESFEIRKYTV